MQLVRLQGHSGGDEGAPEHLLINAAQRLHAALAGLAESLEQELDTSMAAAIAGDTRFHTSVCCRHISDIRSRQHYCFGPPFT